jgi:tetratricopeptide (TPR) repeat protein
MPKSGLIRGREAKTLLAMKRLDEAFAAYKALTEEFPDEEGYRLGLARTCLQQGRHAEALTIVRESLQHFPDSPTLHENAGLILDALKRTPEAEAEFKEAVRLDPRDQGPLLALAALKDKQGATADAMPLYLAAAELSPHSRQGRQAGRRLGAMGEQLAREGNLQGARDAYAAALRSGQAGPPLYLNAAFVSYQLGQRETARAILQEGAARYPQSADLLYRLARLQADRGATAEAEAAYRRAAEADPNRRDARLALARLLESSGRVPEAIAFYEQLARLEPASSETRVASDALHRIRGGS